MVQDGKTVVRHKASSVLCVLEASVLSTFLGVLARISVPIIRGMRKKNREYLPDVQLIVDALVCANFI